MGIGVLDPPLLPRACACFPSPSSMRSYAAFEACRSLASSVEYRRCLSTEDILDKVLLCWATERQLIDAAEATENYTDNVMHILSRLG